MINAELGGAVGWFKINVYEEPKLVTFKKKIEIVWEEDS